MIGALTFKKYRNLDKDALKKMEAARKARYAQVAEKYDDDVNNVEYLNKLDELDKTMPEPALIKARALQGPVAAYGALGALGALGYKYLRRLK